MKNVAELNYVSIVVGYAPTYGSSRKQLYKRHTMSFMQCVRDGRTVDA